MLQVHWAFCVEVAYRVVFSQDTMGVVDRRDIVEEPGTVGVLDATALHMKRTAD